VTLHRAAVLGHPVAHSLSPRLHRAAYQALGLADTWAYGAFDVDEAGLVGFLDGLGPEWAGLSLTMPLKHAVMPLVDHVEPLAQAVGAVNTVLFTPGGRVGTNTDVYGIVQAVREAVADAARPAGFDRVTILGGGATAASALAAVSELGAGQIEVYVRSTARARSLMAAALRMGVKFDFRAWPGEGAVGWAGDLTVSTLPPRAADSLTVVRAPGVLLDVAYDPWPSALAGAWAAAGGTVVSGLTMLLHQAAEQVRLMTGLPAPLAAMRAAL
jgi:shikimate dehydrogenase